MQRALCIWLPQWPLARLAAARDELSEQSVVLYEMHASGGARVTAYCTRLATAAASGWLADTATGIRPGMPLAEATALAAATRDATTRDATDKSSVPLERKGAPRLQRHPSVGSTGETPVAPQHADTPVASQHAERPVASQRTAKQSMHELHLEAADPWADRLALEAVADDCQRFAPAVGVEEAAAPSSLLLDVTGIGDLCGGEMALARRIVEDFRARRLAVRVAVADTPGAAWAATHFAPLECIAAASGDMPDETAILAALARPLVIAPGETSAALAELPPAALRLEADTCQLLAELGIERIEQLAALPRDTLLARFGPQVLLRIDQALGTAAEAIAARAVPPEWTFEWLLEHPTAKREMIEWVVEQLVARVCGALARERRGVLRLACRFVPEQGERVEFVVGLYRPSASERHVGELVRLKLEGLRFRHPLAAIRFEVLALDGLEFQQRELLVDEHPTRDDPRAVAALVDRLGNRLGAHAVVRPWLLAGAQPEFACQYHPVASLQGKRGKKSPGEPPRKKGKTPGATAVSPMPVTARDQHWQDASGTQVAHRRGGRTETPARAGNRPLWLEPRPQALDVVSVIPDGPPVMFRLAGRDHRTVRTWGPERIETGWWRGRCTRRDYYQVETQTGQRYWLFRELNTAQWFLHGRFL